MLPSSSSFSLSSPKPKPATPPDLAIRAVPINRISKKTEPLYHPFWGEKNQPRRVCGDALSLYHRHPTKPPSPPPADEVKPSLSSLRCAITLFLENSNVAGVLEDNLLSTPFLKKASSKNRHLPPPPKSKSKLPPYHSFIFGNRNVAGVWEDDLSSVELDDGRLQKSNGCAGTNCIK